MTIKNPTWWNDQHESRWERVKTAFRRDWEQTKHDVGSDSARDLQQSASDTIKQAAGKQQAAGAVSRPSFDQAEPALRYGHGVRSQYGDKWDKDLETRLQRDYPGDFARDREHIRRGYDYPAV